MTPLAACTIVSKNYLPFARVLADSFHRHHPEGRLFVLLVDRLDAHFDPAREKFVLIEAEELDNVPDLASFLFKYTLLECNTAIKPYFMEHLFERYELENLVYFDPDILVTGSLEELAGLVGRHSIVLTPHLSHPIDDAAHPGEQTVLQVGTYNLGFIALRRDAESARLLAWWQKRLYDHCLVRLEEGLFVDQKWIDLVPGLFGGVYVHTDPGYNVAYWNLHGRRVEARDGAVPTSNGRPLVFFHFSGIDPDDLHHVSKHQDRFVLSDIGGAAELYRHYSALLLAAGYRETRPWPYAFGRFDNGVAIPDAARSLYHGLGRRRRRFGDPFATGGSASYFDWLRQPRKGGDTPSLSRLLGHLYEGREDLVRLFPDADGNDFTEFCAWLDTFGRHEFRLDEAFLEGTLARAGTDSFSLGSLKRNVKNSLKRVYRSELGVKTRRYGKRLLGHERYQELRQRVRKAAPGQAGARQTLPLGRYRLPVPESLESAGVNVVGYFQAETGMGEAARCLARACETTDVPVTRHSLDLTVLARPHDTFEAATSDFRHAVNLFVVNADQVAAVFEHLGAEVFAGRYNVGFWLWELETFPQTWRGAFDLLHEVWTPSTFCVDAISKVSPVPVRRVPIPVEVALEGDLGRDHFGLPAAAFVFLYTFNFLSYFERKNPLALVRAFKKAFAEDEDALLVLKTSQSDFAPQAHEEVLREIEGANIRLIDEYLSRSEIDHLSAVADCYVSLHRSEGFGLTLAEAMYLGKPVVATAYSGNVDFFNLNNGCPVRYRLVELESDAGPYPAHARWAEPDEDHAAELLRWVYEHRQEARELAARGRSDVERELSYSSVGRELERRFREVLGEVGRRGARLPL